MGDNAQTGARTGRGLVSSRELLDEARRGRWAVAALNFYNAETLRAHVDAAVALDAPVILQTTESTIRYLGIRLAVAMARAAAEECSRPVALHLDHGKTLGAVSDALAAKFTSIMIDASEEPYEENVATSAAARRMCGPGIALEAELGSIGGKEDEVGADLAAATDPAQVPGFVDAVGCDMLAVSVGNVHGYAPDARIDFERLAAVREVSPVPLVIHGGSGLPEDQLGRLHEFGVVKVNVASDLRNAFIRTFGEAYAANPDEVSLIRVSRDAVAAVADVVERRIRLLNSAADRLGG